jgi:23S rRNA pseudouridine955/2504/2580 synthase
VGYLLDKKIITEDSLNKFKPSVCNRLDRNTDGLVICANNYESARILTGIIKDRTVKKYYKCTVEGNCELEGTFKAYLVKDNKTNKVTVSDKPFNNSKEIITAFKPLEYKDDKTVMEVDLITGKSHQIRAHLASIGHPLAGDMKYGDEMFNRSVRDKYKIKSQVLRAYRMVFPKDCGELKQLNGKEIKLDKDDEFFI